MHCILESTFARIFLFLELLFLQEAQFYRENLSQSSSLEGSSDLPAFTVTFRRDHFMWGKHTALFWLGILNSACESSHPQCSKNKKIRAKVDSEGLYGRGKLLFMGSWLHILKLWYEIIYHKLYLVVMWFQSEINSSRGGGFTGHFRNMLHTAAHTAVVLVPVQLNQAAMGLLMIF